MFIFIKNAKKRNVKKMPKESAPGLSFIPTTIFILSFLNWIISKYLNKEQLKDMLAVK